MKVREDIHELSDRELATALDEFACVVREDMAGPRTAEVLNEAATRLRTKGEAK
jgi:hypothetical protein